MLIRGQEFPICFFSFTDILTIIRSAVSVLVVVIYISMHHHPTPVDAGHTRDAMKPRLF